MLEARNEYGFYGSAGGYTGETPPRASKAGYHFFGYEYKFSGERLSEETVAFMAVNKENADKQAKRYAKQRRPNDGNTKIEFVRCVGQAAKHW